MIRSLLKISKLIMIFFITKIVLCNEEETTEPDINDISFKGISQILDIIGENIKKQYFNKKSSIQDVILDQNIKVLLEKNDPAQNNIYPKSSIESKVFEDMKNKLIYIKQYTLNMNGDENLEVIKNKIIENINQIINNTNSNLKVIDGWVSASQWDFELLITAYDLKLLNLLKVLKKLHLSFISVITELKRKTKIYDFNNIKNSVTNDFQKHINDLSYIVFDFLINREYYFGLYIIDNNLSEDFKKKKSLVFSDCDKLNYIKNFSPLVIKSKNGEYDIECIIDFKEFKKQFMSKLQKIEWGFLQRIIFNYYKRRYNKRRYKKYYSMILEQETCKLEFSNTWEDLINKYKDYTDYIETEIII